VSYQYLNNGTKENHGTSFRTSTLPVQIEPGAFRIRFGIQSTEPKYLLVIDQTAGVRIPLKVFLYFFVFASRAAVGPLPVGTVALRTDKNKHCQVGSAEVTATL
jgi:hypothetical protein